MRLKTLIEFAIIAAVIFFAYNALLYAVNIFITIGYYAFDSSYFNIGSAGTMLFYCILYMVAFFVIIKNKEGLAAYIAGNSANEPVPVRIRGQQLLYIIIIAIGISSIIGTLPKILIYLFNSFRDSVSNSLDHVERYGRNTQKEEFWVSLTGLVLSVIMIRFADPITSFLLKKKIQEPGFDFETEDINDKPGTNV